jgi:hypothetical protein
MALSHAKDKPIAAALLSVVQKFDKSWYRRRALRVFRAPWQLPPASSFRGYSGGADGNTHELLAARYIDGYTGKPPLQK